MRYSVAFLIVALVFVLAGCGGDDERPDTTAAAETPVTDAEPTEAPTATEAPPQEMAWVDIVELLSPSTVMVRSNFPASAIDFESQGGGTGIVYTDDGYIVTNAHVVGGAAAVTVSEPGSTRERSARIVGMSPCDDVAVLKIDDMSGLAPATFGDVSEQRVGAEVAALGYPLGSMLGTDLTISSGVISKLNEPIPPLESLIQHDASLSPGNSGGPLVNRLGEVIGINALGFDPTVASNINFAISMDYAARVIEDLETGKNRHWIGMNLAPNLYPDYFGAETGLVVSAVASGSSASEVGIVPADLLTHLEGLSVNSMEDICRILRSHEDGDSLRVELMSVTETELLFLEGEIVMGDENGGSDLKVVYRESLVDPETDGGDNVGSDGNGSGTSEQLTIGTWQGTAEIELEYWVPCGVDGAWEQYFINEITLDVYVWVDTPYDGESNPYYIEIWTDPLDEEGSFRVVSSIPVENQILEHWQVGYDGYRVSGELVDTGEEFSAISNAVYSSEMEDPCDLDSEIFFYEFPISTGTNFNGQLGPIDGYLFIGGGTTTGHRDYFIEITLERVE